MDGLDNTVMAKGEAAQIRWPQRPSKHNLLIPLPPLPITHEGEYDLVILARNQEVDRQKFTVVVVPPPPEPETPEENGDA